LRRRISRLLPISLNADRTGPVMPLLFAANMLVNTDDGDTYSFEEIQGWLTEAALRTHVFWNPPGRPADSRDEAVEGQPRVANPKRAG